MWNGAKGAKYNMMILIEGIMKVAKTFKTLSPTLQSVLMFMKLQKLSWNRNRDKTSQVSKFFAAAF